MWDYLVKNYKHSQMNKRPNYKFIPVSVIPLGREGMEEFNKIYFFIKNNGIRKIVRTNRGGISTNHRVFFDCAYDARVVSSTVIELTLIHHLGMWRIQFRTPVKTEENPKGLYGKQAWDRFLRKCKELGVDIEKFKIENGYSLKKDMPKVMIGYADDDKDISDKVFEGVHHIDFHSSHPAGMCESYPELYPVFEWFFDRRKEDEMNKLVMNSSWGMTYSPITGYDYILLAKAGLENTNKRLKDIADRLTATGRKVLAFNTDGVWYQGEVYHGEGEGKKMGQWENDHIDCIIRFKSKGCYEYIENGEYHPVVRGKTRLDEIKPRSEWEWGDIYNKPEIVNVFGFTEELGIFEYEGEIDK